MPKVGLSAQVGNREIVTQATPSDEPNALTCGFTVDVSPNGCDHCHKYARMVDRSPRFTVPGHHPRALREGEGRSRRPRRVRAPGARWRPLPGRAWAGLQMDVSEVLPKHCQGEAGGQWPVRS